MEMKTIFTVILALPVVIIAGCVLACIHTSAKWKTKEWKEDRKAEKYGEQLEYAFDNEILSKKLLHRTQDLTKKQQKEFHQDFDNCRYLDIEIKHND